MIESTINVSFDSKQAMRPNNHTSTVVFILYQAVNFPLVGNLGTCYPTRNIVEEVTDCLDDL